MRSIYILFSLLLSLAISSSAQTSWMLAESIDQENAWNRPYFTAYNSADKLLSNQTDSSIYCRDCSLSALIWKGIESNKIVAYQTDKSAALIVQKSAALKKKLQTFIASTEEHLAITDAFHHADIFIYRRAVNDKPNQIRELTIEWVSIHISLSDKSFIVYIKAKDCFAFLKTATCYWVHPLDMNMKANFANVLVQRNYIAKDYKVVAAYNLQSSSMFTLANTPLAQDLIRADQLSDKTIASSSDGFLFQMKAICSADIRSMENRGYYKVQLPGLLMNLHGDGKIKGYEYHEAGYLTPMTTKKLREHFIVETEEDGEYVVKRVNLTSLTRLHVLKTEIKTDASAVLRNEWLILGIGEDVSTSFSNTYVIAFSFDEVLTVLSTAKLYWYNGSNESDSLLLAEALRTQRIAYDKMIVTTVYGDTIVTGTNKSAYKEIKSDNTLAALYYGQSTALITDFDAPHKRINHPGKEKIESFELHYVFKELPNHSEIAEGIIEGIKSNKLRAYKDENLREPAASSEVILLLDKARFYKTGNAKKDSIYISKIPMDERYINIADLTEYSLATNYKTINGKGTNTARSFGIFIPAEIHPQYEQEVLCYVSYSSMLKYLASLKTTKKYIKQLKGLPNEKTIVEVLDFYGVLRYDAIGWAEVGASDLPVFVRERVKK